MMYAKPWHMPRILRGRLVRQKDGHSKGPRQPGPIQTVPESSVQCRWGIGTRDRNTSTSSSCVKTEVYNQGYVSSAVTEEGSERQARHVQRRQGRSWIEDWLQLMCCAPTPILVPLFQGVGAISVHYKERYLKACAQRSLCRRYVTQSFEAQLLCNCDKRSMT